MMRWRVAFALALSRVALKPTPNTLVGVSRTLRFASTESELHEKLMRDPPYPWTELEAHEWNVSAGKGSDLGVGDLVFKQPDTNRYLVVEAKMLKSGGGGRAKLEEQARFYGGMWKEKHPNAKVKYAIFSNVFGLEILGKVSGEVWETARQTLRKRAGSPPDDELPIILSKVKGPICDSGKEDSYSSEDESEQKRTKGNEQTLERLETLEKKIDLIMTGLKIPQSE